MTKTLFILNREVDCFHIGQDCFYLLEVDFFHYGPNCNSFNIRSILLPLWPNFFYFFTIRVDCFHYGQTCFLLILEVDGFHYGPNCFFFFFQYQKQTALIMAKNQFLSILKMYTPFVMAKTSEFFMLAGSALLSLCPKLHLIRQLKQAVSITVKTASVFYMQATFITAKTVFTFSLKIGCSHLEPKYVFFRCYKQAALPIRPTLFFQKFKFHFFHYYPKCISFESSKLHYFIREFKYALSITVKTAFFSIKEVNCFHYGQNCVCFDTRIKLLQLWPKSCLFQY